MDSRLENRRLDFERKVNLDWVEPDLRGWDWRGSGLIGLDSSLGLNWDSREKGYLSDSDWDWKILVDFCSFGCCLMKLAGLSRLIRCFHQESSVNPLQYSLENYSLLQAPRGPIA